MVSLLYQNDCYDLATKLTYMYFYNIRFDPDALDWVFIACLKALAKQKQFLSLDNTPPINFTYVNIQLK